MATRETTWSALVLQADPDHVRTSRRVIEYEFTAPGRGDDRTHEGGRRVFMGDYSVRGPYAPQAAADGGLTWNGIQIVWSGDSLVWDGD